MPLLLPRLLPSFSRPLAACCLVALSVITSGACFPDLKLAPDDTGVTNDGGVQPPDATVDEAGISAGEGGTQSPPDGGAHLDGATGQGDAGAVDVHRLIGAGNAHVCVIHGASHALYCWGENGRGQLGRTTSTTEVPTPDTVKVAFDPLLNVVETTVVGDVACALTSDGAVRCWGNTISGAVGNGVSTESAADPGAPLALPDAGAPLGSRATSIIGSNLRNCALLSGNQVACWGVGNGLGPVLRPSPALVPAIDAGIAMLSVGTSEAANGGEDCVLTSEAAPRILCWGMNNEGVCAVASDVACNQTSDIACVGKPTAIPTITGAVQVAASATVACAVFGPERRVACWGGNVEYSQLGSQPGGRSGVTGGYLPNPIYTEAGAPLVSVGEVAVAFRHTCAIVGAERRVVCWGDATQGNLGNGETPAGGTNVSRALPQDVLIDVQQTPLVGVAQITTTGEFGCALKLDDTVWCWGVNGSGQLGVASSAVAASGYARKVALP